MNSYYAVVITDNDPPAGVGCGYQVQVSSTPDTYQCLTKEKYEAMQAQQRANDEAAWNNTKAFIADYWGWILLGILGLWLLFGIVGGFWERLDKRRNPWKYDKYGNNVFTGF